MNPRVRLKTKDQKREDMNETVRKTRGRKVEYKNDRTLTRGQKREDNSKLDYRNERTLIDFRDFRRILYHSSIMGWEKYCPVFIPVDAF